MDVPALLPTEPWGTRGAAPAIWRGKFDTPMKLFSLVFAFWAEVGLPTGPGLYGSRPFPPGPKTEKPPSKFEAPAASRATA